ncbi:MAG: HEAT repeat domain-containing protein [Planctomycetota bacterium]
MLVVGAVAKEGDLASIESLTGALANPDSKVREQAARVLGGFGPAAIPALEGCLDPGVAPRDQRVAALMALSKIAVEDPRAVQSIEGRLSDPEELVVVAASYFLSQLGTSGLEALIRALRAHPSALARRYAAITLARRAPDPRALPALIAALDDPDRFVRGGAYVAFAEGYRELPGAEAVREQIEALLVSQEPAERAVALAALPGDSGFEPALRALEDESAVVRHAALHALTSTFRDDPRLRAELPRLVALLVDPDEELRTYAGHHLRYREPLAKELLPTLVRLLYRSPANAPRFEAEVYARDLTGIATGWELYGVLPRALWPELLALALGSLGGYAFVFALRRRLPRGRWRHLCRLLVVAGPVGAVLGFAWSVDSALGADLRLDAFLPEPVFGIVPTWVAGILTLGGTSALLTTLALPKPRPEEPS